MNWEDIKYMRVVIWGMLTILLLLLPLFTSRYIQSILIFIQIYSLVAIGLCLLTGFAGQISLAQGAFYGIGAYTSAIISLRLDISPFLGMVCGASVAGIVAYVLGKRFLRIRGFYLALITFGFALFVDNIFYRFDFLTGGHDGISGIPNFSIGGFIMNKDFHYYYLLLVAISFAFFLARNLLRSEIGREMRAVDLFTGGSEIASSALGVNIGRLKTKIFVIASIYAAVAGSIYAHYMTHIHPQPFDISSSLLFLTMIVIGGIKSLWGGIIGAIFYIGSRELISYFMGGATGWDLIVYALVFLLVLMFLPEGLISFPQKIYLNQAGKTTPYE